MSVLRKVPAKLQKLIRRRNLSKSDNGTKGQPLDSASSPSSSEKSSSRLGGSPSVDMSFPSHDLQWPFDQLNSESRTRSSTPEGLSKTNGKQGHLDAETIDDKAKVAYVFSKDNYALHARAIEAGKVVQLSRSRSSPTTRRRR